MKYKAIDNFSMTHGKIFIVENEKERTNFKDLIGQEVEIDGTKYICKGVESHAIPVIKQGKLIGILV